MTDKTAKLTIGNDSWDFPVRSGTIGPDIVDISSLYGQTDHFTFDPGFTSTAACESDITFIDGDKGILLHRGYPIEQL
ncbi:MAG: citrate (Si)-synthase, partial [Nitratireductor sp.]|nr:citrate (Si)-synthase [Nitratireductor sp.]